MTIRRGRIAGMLLMFVAGCASSHSVARAPSSCTVTWVEDVRWDDLALVGAVTLPQGLAAPDVTARVESRACELGGTVVARLPPSLTDAEEGFLVFERAGRSPVVALTTALGLTN